MYGPFGGTVKAWNSCEHLANIVRRRLRLQLHNVLRSLVTRGTHALSPCKIVYRKKGDKPPAASATRAQAHHGHTGTSIIELRISARAFTFQQTRATRVRHEAGGSETETAQRWFLSRSRARCADRRACADRTRARARPLTAHAPPPGTGTGTGSKLAQSHR